ncbi:tol protein [Apiospora saccharicola]
MDTICSRCAKIDWPDLIRQANPEDPLRLRSRHRTGNRQHVCLANFPVETLRSACAVCNILTILVDEQQRCGNRVERIEFTTRNDDFFGDAHTLTPQFHGTMNCKMPDIKPDYSKRWPDRVPGMVYHIPQELGMWWSDFALGMAFRKPWEVGLETKALRKVDDKNVDLVLMRAWIAQCSERHGDACNTAVSELIPSLRVINAHTGLIETAKPGCKYVALSYVWGKSTLVEKGSAGARGRGLLDTAPQTIQDAAWLTRELGCQYIWIDRYCIPQDDPQAKHDQIKRMDLVYKQAQLTIIAAAGEGPDFGLPGIGYRPRQIQARAQLNNDQYLVEADRECFSFLRSLWRTRGWTYQESVCSQRCIIFTTKEMMFQCKTMFCRETVYNSEQRDIFAVLAETKPPNIWEHIEEYSNRRLSYASDALNGMLGIFRLYRINQTPVYHFWGIPFSASNGHSSAEEQFLASLCWLSAPRTSMYQYASQCRRAEFPSWSWTGWQHEVLPFFTGDKKPVKITGTVSVQCSNDSSVSQFEEFYEQRIKTDLLGDNTKFLTIECWTVELDVSIPHLSARAALAADGNSEAFAWPVNKYGQKEDTIVATPPGP